MNINLHPSIPVMAGIEVEAGFNTKVKNLQAFINKYRPVYSAKLQEINLAVMSKKECLIIHCI